jgi:hypothetical protein
VSAYPGAGAGEPVDDDGNVPMDERPTLPGGVLGVPHGGRAVPPPVGADVFARRWAVLAALVTLLVIVVAVAFRSHPPVLYWQGEPIVNAQEALGTGQAAMGAVVSGDEAAALPQSRCYFSLSGPTEHDVAAFMRCGPVLLPWSSRSRAWLTYGLHASFTGSGERLTVQTATPSMLTVALVKGEVLRRPDGQAPPGYAGLKVPVAPRQPAGWGGVLDAPPRGLQPAPSGLIGDWGRSYRLVAFGEVSGLSASLDEAALRAAIDPPGSGWATVASRARGSRPLAKLLLPAKGQVLVVAELAVGPGEASGAVPSEANGASAASSDSPAIELLGGTTAATLDVPPGPVPARLTVAASVPLDSRPVLEISDRGLAQGVSLVSGKLVPGPGVLARTGTDEHLSVTGKLPGVTVDMRDAALVWFAGSDGGTVPPRPGEAYLQVLAGASPRASLLPVWAFTLRMGRGQVVRAQALPDSDRSAVVVGFLVPSSFSDGTVVVSEGGESFHVRVHFG